MAAVAAAAAAAANMDAHSHVPKTIAKSNHSN